MNSSEPSSRVNCSSNYARAVIVRKLVNLDGGLLPHAQRNAAPSWQHADRRKVLLGAFSRRGGFCRVRVERGVAPTFLVVTEADDRQSLRVLPRCVCPDCAV